MRMVTGKDASAGGTERGVTGRRALLGRVAADAADGAILVWVALMTIVLLGAGALAVDLGYAYAVKQQLSSTADSAALAGAQEAAMVYRSTGGCPDGTPTGALESAVLAAVAANHAENDPDGDSPVPGADDVDIECADGTEVTVSVAEQSSVDTWFGRVLGVDSLDPVANATASVVGATLQGGLRPFTVCLEDALAGATSPYPTRESIYVQHNSPPTTEERVGNGRSSWSATTDAVTEARHGLVPGDLVRIEIVSGLTGTASGLYYVLASTPDTFTLSGSPSGSPVNVTADGVVAVYKQTTGLVAGGALAWEADDETIAAPGHLLADGDEVRLSIVSGATGAEPGTYFVIDATADSVRLSTTPDGPVQTISVDGVVDLYEVFRENTPGACNPTLTPGNWGYARFDLGGDNQTLKCLIEFGYNGDEHCSGEGAQLGDNDPQTPEVTSPGNPGNDLQVPPNPQGQENSDLLAMMRALVDTTIVLPVAEVWSEQGQNAQYTAKGGVGVTFCGFIFTRSNNDPSVGARGGPGSCWVESMYLDAVARGKLDDATLYIQWQYTDDYVGTYFGQNLDPENRCRLGDPTCIPALRLLK